jgi:hypothetical protein
VWNRLQALCAGKLGRSQQGDQRNIRAFVEFSFRSLPSFAKEIEIT